MNLWANFKNHKYFKAFKNLFNYNLIFQVNVFRKYAYIFLKFFPYNNALQMRYSIHLLYSLTKSKST